MPEQLKRSKRKCERTEQKIAVPFDHAVELIALGYLNKEASEITLKGRAANLYIAK